MKNNKDSGDSGNNQKNITINNNNTSDNIDDDDINIETEKNENGNRSRNYTRNKKRSYSSYVKNSEYSNRLKPPLKSVKNRNFNLIIILFTMFVLFFGILIFGYIYRDSIYNFLSKKSMEDQNVLGIATSKAENNVTAQITTEPTISSENSITSNATIFESVPSDTSQTILTTETPETTPTVPPPVIQYISNIPKSEFIQKMFDDAVSIPESQNKVELPPQGRNMELQNKIVPLSNEIPEPYAYFKNIILLGDSVTTGFEMYKSKILFNGENVLKDINVVAVTSYGIYNATRDISNKSVHPLYDGEQMLPEDRIAMIDAKYVFICLGLNDLTWAETDDFITFYGNLVEKIKSKNPDKIIAVMSVTPVIEGNPNLTNEKIMAANNALIQFASENNLPFIDYAAAIRDSDNSLLIDLSSDGYCHIKTEAYDRLVAYLLYHPIKN